MQDFVSGLVSVYKEQCQQLKSPFFRLKNKKKAIQSFRCSNGKIKLQLYEQNVRQIVIKRFTHSFCQEWKMLRSHGDGHNIKRTKLNRLPTKQHNCNL